MGMSRVRRWTQYVLYMVISVSLLSNMTPFVSWPYVQLVTGLAVSPLLSCSDDTCDGVSDWAREELDAPVVDVLSGDTSHSGYRGAVCGFNCWILLFSLSFAFKAPCMGWDDTGLKWWPCTGWDAPGPKWWPPFSILSVGLHMTS